MYSWSQFDYYFNLLENLLEYLHFHFHFKLEKELSFLTGSQIFFSKWTQNPGQVHFLGLSQGSFELLFFDKLVKYGKIVTIGTEYNIHQKNKKNVPFYSAPFIAIDFWVDFRQFCQLIQNWLNCQVKESTSLKQLKLLELIIEV